MSYPKDLDEYSNKELQDELDRRAKYAKQGKCTYCRHLYTCRFPGRHRGDEASDYSWKDSFK